MASVGVDPLIVRHPTTVLPEEEHNRSVRELWQETLGSRRLHRGAALAASGAARGDIRCAVRDDAAGERPVVIAVRASVQPKADRRIGTTATMAVKPIG